MPEAYAIEIGPEAKADIDEILVWLEENLPGLKEEWLDGLAKSINKLQFFPERCRLAPENGSLVFEHEMRQLLYGEGRGQYRILFWVDQNLVRIIRIRHSAQRWLHQLEDEEQS